jgi:hypothetical protein
VCQADTGAIWGVALSADGQLVASGGVDGLVRLVGCVEWRPESRWTLRSIAFASGTKCYYYLLVVTRDGSPTRKDGENVCTTIVVLQGEVTPNALAWWQAWLCD